uniref:RAB11 family interacting protein 4 n=1 Tax=Homo sapiens TaxID=9606 RepID=K7EMK3_HUMAN
MRTPPALGSQHQPEVPQPVCARSRTEPNLPKSLSLHIFKPRSLKPAQETW